MEALPIGQIDLPITFGTSRNFCTETLTFKVVGFSGMYHAILERPVYVKFMVVPNYMYLKLKILARRGSSQWGLRSSTLSNVILIASSLLRQ
jgi:hypothetical protein